MLVSTTLVLYTSSWPSFLLASLLLPRALAAELSACLLRSRLCRHTSGHTPSPTKEGAPISQRDGFIACASGASSWGASDCLPLGCLALVPPGLGSFGESLSWGFCPPPLLPPDGGLESVAVCEEGAGPLPPPFAPTSPSA